MNGPVHTVIGLSTGVIGATFLYNSLPVLQESALGPTAYVIAITYGSVFPDLDLNGRPLHFLGGHRGLTHTLVGPALCIGLMQLAKNSEFGELAGIFRAAMFGFVIGWLLHILADTFQRKGVPLFWPLSRARVHIASIPVKYDKYICFFYLVCLVLIGVALGDTTVGIVKMAATMPGVAIAIVVAVFELRKAMLHVAKQNKRYQR